MLNSFGDGRTLRHRDRKNPGSADFFKKQRKDRNLARGKQVWIGGKIVEGGHWSRISADSSAS